MNTSIDVITGDGIELVDFHSLWIRFLNDGFTLENLSSITNVDIQILKKIRFDEDGNLLNNDESSLYVVFDFLSCFQRIISSRYMIF